MRLEFTGDTISEDGKSYRLALVFNGDAERIGSSDIDPLKLALLEQDGISIVEPEAKEIPESPKMVAVSQAKAYTEMEVSKVRTELTEVSEGLAKELAEIKGLLEDAKTDVANLTKEKNAVFAEKEILAKQVTDLTAQNATLTKQVADLTKKAASTEAQKPT